MKITINGTEKTVDIKKVYTREIDRWYNNYLMEWVSANTNEPNNINIPLNNIQKANDYLVMAMTDLTEKEVNNISSEDFNAILGEIVRIKNGS